jgi:hypothetical protein
VAPLPPTPGPCCIDVRVAIKQTIIFDDVLY